MSLRIADVVKETSVTTGVGALALAGAMTGYRAFSDVCSVADTLFYMVRGVDASGNPTGEWETGLGTYSGVNTLTRTTPQASSNGGAAVNFSAGTKHVWLDLSATQIGGFATTASVAATLSAYATTAYVDAADALKAPLASPTLTGVPAAPTAAVDTNTTQLATTAFVITQAYAKLASPALTGTPTAPTAAPATNSTQLATTAYADAIAVLKANLASPTFTGTATAPTINATTGATLGNASATTFDLASNLSGSNDPIVTFADAAVQIRPTGSGTINQWFGNIAACLGGSTSLGWSSGSSASASPDTTLIRDGAANTLALKNGNNAQEYRVYGGNGGFISNVKTVTELLTIAAAATTVGVTSIPAGAILLGVSVRVTTVIPTAATFTYATTVGGTALNTAAVSTAATSTDPGTAAGASYRAAATTITITPNLTPGAATGVVRLQYYYLQITPPTS